MPLEFLKRKGDADKAAPVQQPATPSGLPEEVVAQDFQLKLYYAGKSTEGVRMRAGPQAMAELPRMLEGLDPAPGRGRRAAAARVRPGGARSSPARPRRCSGSTPTTSSAPVTRHALVVLESIDAVDLAFDTFVCTLLDGETDTSGYPDYNAIVGGLASHWDEATGDMIVRGVVGWGGRGVRGDTDRIASRILAGILTNILASQYAMGLTAVDRPVPAAGRGGLVCAHCGFASGHERAFYCPKCGMRLLRG